MGIDPPRNPQNSPKEGRGEGIDYFFVLFFFLFHRARSMQGSCFMVFGGPWGSYKEVGFLYGGYSLFLFLFLLVSLALSTIYLVVYWLAY